MSTLLRSFLRVLRYNLLTLRAKFLVDDLLGRNGFVHAGKRIDRTTPAMIPHPETIWFPTTFFLDRGLAWQATLALALQTRGHRVVFSHLDIAFPRRNALYFDVQDRGFIMAYYRLFTDTFLSSFGFTHHPMSRFGNTRRYAAYRRQVGNLDRQACEAFTYHDLPIGRYVRNPLIHYFRCSTTTTGSHILEAQRDFLAMAMVMVDTFERALDKVQPTRVVLLNGSFLDSQIQLALARRRGIRVITFEAGFMLNALMIGENEPIISFPMAKYLPPAYAHHTLTEEQESKLSTYLNSRSQGKDNVFDYWRGPIVDDREIRRQIGLRPDVVPDILFTNLLWDSAMLDCDIAFPDQLQWILHTIDWYRQHPERTLLIRIHPAEVTPPSLASTDRIADAIHRAVPVLPPNVTIIPPTSRISSYPLTALSNLNLVYSSTAGLEAAIMGKPVVVAGKTHYRQQGFTHDIDDVTTYDRLLAEPQLPSSEQQVVRQARRYAFFFFFGFNVPFPLVTERPTNAEGDQVALNFTSTSQLRSGQDPGLDFFVGMVLGTTDYHRRLNALL